MTSRIPAALLLAALPAFAGDLVPVTDPGSLQSHIRSGGPPRDGIPAMTNPETDAAAAVTWVQDSDMVIGVVRNGVARAYPEALGWWHEIINDEVGGQFVTVTLCPLTGTPLVFDATDADGSQVEFGVSGLLINSNLVMYDRRDDATLFPQMIYTAINGSREGERLNLLPAIVTTFGMWKQMYPESDVARFGTGLERYPASQQGAYVDEQRFRIYPYDDYRTNNGYFIAPLTTGSPDLSVYLAKEVVTGLCVNDAVRAYPFADMAPEAVINDTLGGEPVLVVFHLDSRTSIPYSRRVDDQVLSFYQVEAEGDLPVEYMDVETGSRWDLLGRAIDGPLRGRQLEPLPAYNSMWFAWSVYWPQTTVWIAGQGVLAEPPPVTAVLEPTGMAVPEDFELQSAYPNPFNPTTRIRFALPAEGPATLAVYNAGGQRVRSLATGRHTAGTYEVTWDGRDDAGRPVATGTYIYRLHLPDSDRALSSRMTLVR